MRKRILKRICILLMFFITLNFSNVTFADGDYDYSNPIYSEGINDTVVYDTTDSVITTRTGVPRNLPEVTGLYDITSYPIPLINQVPDEATFELIKAENRTIMDKVEEDIKNGTLTKHKAADGQFYGSVPNEALGVEKKIYINTNVKGDHSLASYVPAGEIAIVKLNDEALKYAKQGKIKISVGMTMVDAERYSHNHGIENRMPYLGKTFSISESETKVGTPFGGMIFLNIAESVPSGANIEVDVMGVVDTPYYDLGKTTTEEWQASKDAPGIFAEIRTPYLRFILPAKFIRHIDDLYKAAVFWTNATTLSASVMGLEKRTTPMTLTFDQYITAGIAYASVGSWTCNLPPDWAEDAFDYDGLMKNGNWGIIHEINHHYQSRYSGYYDEWGLGDDFGEITNNALSTLSYILYTNIAASRGEDGTYDWNKVADPYSSLKQQIFEGIEYYPDKPNMGNFMFSTFAHEIGPLTFANVVKSTYEGGTFNGIYIPAYDYKLEGEGGISRNDRYDDMAYRLCVASGRDYTWYMKNELHWPLKQQTIDKIKALKYEEVIPVQSVYAMGEVGRETGRPFYIPSSGYTFDFQKSLVSPGNVTVIDVSQPKYGALNLRDDGKYDYLASKSMPENALDEFILTVRVEKDGISHDTKLNCTISLDYNASIVEHFNIVKWDIYEALDALRTSTPYESSTSTGMKIDSEDGDKLSRSNGYFMIDEDGKYEFQVFGDDRAAFQLHLGDKTILQSITNDYAKTADDAIELSKEVDSNGRKKSTKFIVNLEANKVYSYTLVAKNIGGIGWADVNIRKTSGDTSWKSITKVYCNLDDVGKITDKNYIMPDPEYIRPSILATSDETLLKGLTVISTPQGVVPTDDPNTHNEGIKENIVDGDINTYFHSSYDNSNKTSFPHEYIFDLGGEKDFNNLEIYTRTYDHVGVIGDYEIFITDEYEEDQTVWTQIFDDKTRKGNSSALADIKISLPKTKAKYLKIRALNNRDGYDITIVSEVKLSNKTNVKNVIAQDSSFIQYEGDWKKDSNGAFVNGATYNTTTGYFMYCFEGNESNIYVAKDVQVEIRIDGGKWEEVKLIGSLREPSITLNMPNEGKHVIEVRAVNEEIALNMISTDGIFYKGKAPDKSNPPVIYGADNITIGVGQVDRFDKMSGVSYSDDIDTTGLQIKVTGELGEPTPGTNKEYILTYTVTDGDRNTTTVDRVVTVTNQLPVITGLDDIVINEGESNEFDFANGISATDLEDGNLINSLQLPTMDLSGLTEGNYSVKYEVTDSDNNTTIAERKIIVLPKNIDGSEKPEEPPVIPDIPEVPGEKPEEPPVTPDIPEVPGEKPEEPPVTPDIPEVPGEKPEEAPVTPDMPEVPGEKPEEPPVISDISEAAGKDHGDLENKMEDISSSDNINSNDKNNINKENVPNTGNILSSNDIILVSLILLVLGGVFVKKNCKF